MRRGPFCRDCADHDGVCPHDGSPCVGYATQLRKFAELRRKFPGRRPVITGDFTHACESGAAAINQLAEAEATIRRLTEAHDTLRFGATTLAQEVLASKQNVGNYLKGLANNVIRLASLPLTPATEERTQ